MRLSEQVSEAEYVTKKHVLLGQNAKTKGKLDDFQKNKDNRFEPAIQFVLGAKQGEILLSQGTRTEKRDFLKKIGRTSKSKTERFQARS